MNPDMFSPDFIADTYVRSMETQAAAHNAAVVAGYDLAYKNAVQASDATGSFDAPAVVKLTAIDPIALKSLFLNWSANLVNGFVPFDYSSATTIHDYSKPAPTKTVVVLPQPADPVGFALGNGFFTRVPGDTSPIGRVVVNTRGVFVLAGNETPFGLMAEYRQAA